VPSIRLNKKTGTIKVVNRTEKIRITNRRNNVKLQRTGATGPQGPQGIQGAPGSGGDKTYTQAFVVTDTVSVTHNLEKLPAVSVMDSTNNEVIGDVEYINDNLVTLRFSAPFSGKVTCN